VRGLRDGPDETGTRRRGETDGIGGDLKAEIHELMHEDGEAAASECHAQGTVGVRVFPGE